MNDTGLQQSHTVEVNEEVINACDNRSIHSHIAMAVAINEMIQSLRLAFNLRHHGLLCQKIRESIKNMLKYNKEKESKSNYMNCFYLLVFIK